MNKTGGKSRRGDPGRRLLQGSKTDGGLDLGGGSGDQRTALRNDLRRILVVETRDPADRMDLRGEGE